MTIKEVFEKFGLNTVRALQKNLDSRDINANGNLRRDIDYNVFNLGGDTRFILNVAKPSDEYAYFVDKGRRAGKMPPIEPIEQWITKKGVDVSPFMTKKKNSLKARRTLAFLVARKIGQKGTKPTNFWSDVVTPELFNGLKKDLAKAAKDQIKFDFKLK